ncbi:MAG TPA: hypothetical protein VK659_08485, partial [Asanoa sp.]|nr:hypothetical protein [Asanoa sp.]
IVEAKSLLGPTEADRLRLGLGEILDCRHRFSEGQDGAERPQAYLLVAQIEDNAWHTICRDVDVRLLVATDSDTWKLN